MLPVVVVGVEVAIEMVVDVDRAIDVNVDVAVAAAPVPVAVHRARRGESSVLRILAGNRASRTNKRARAAGRHPAWLGP